jgi:uncharacterized protein YcsI (UPF0317 family)
MDLSHLPALEPDPQAHEPRRLRGLIAKGSITGTSRGLALGYLQCNLAMVPQSHAGDFLEYCKRNARACPVLEVTAPATRSGATGIGCPIAMTSPSTGEPIWLAF